jgi:nicotinate (nicotinamide) nucleotide adenylyltransferase
MAKQIVIFGGSFNPPGNHHVEIARQLAERFDEVVVVPCGPRSDKGTTTDSDTVHRAIMCDMAFRGIPRVRVDLFDLERVLFTPTRELADRYRDADTEVWHCIGADLVKGGAEGASQIQRSWVGGNDLWNDERFVVWNRDGYPLNDGDLPPRSVRVDSSVGGASSSVIRSRVMQHEAVHDLVPADVHRHIERYGLYRGLIPHRSTPLALDGLRPVVVSDPRDRATRLVHRAGFRPGDRHDDPNCILVSGGDGTMLHAIQKYWRMRLPFIGLNGGTVGFLLNDEARAFPAGSLLHEWNVVHHPLLNVEYERADGTTDAAIGFNEAWIERSEGQTAWTKVHADGNVLLNRLMSDGVLVATPAGTTAYASSMGVHPLPLDEHTLTIVGSNVFRPKHWKSAPVSMHATIDLEPIDIEKRPVRLFVDGVPKGLVRKVRIRASRTASAALAFAPSYDMAAKVIAEQFGDNA